MQLIKVMDADAIEDGVWFHLSHPAVEGEMLFKDEKKTLPCRVKVRSTQSKIYRSTNLRLMTKNNSRITRAKLSERDQIQADALAENTAQWFAIVLVATENLDVEKPGEVVPTQEEAIAIAKDSDAQWLVDQVINFSADGKNYGLPENPPLAAPKSGQRSKSSSPS